MYNYFINIELYDELKNSMLIKIIRFENYMIVLRELCVF